MSTQTDDGEMMMRTKCCTARTELVTRNGHTFRQCENCGKSSPKREAVTLDEAQSAFEARQ